MHVPACIVKDIPVIFVCSLLGNGLVFGIHVLLSFSISSLPFCGNATLLVSTNNIAHVQLNERNSAN